jgi:tetratricopeptide (TPR) repeat protein
MRDWRSAAALEPVAGSTPQVSTLVYWARAVAHGRLRQPEQARTDLARYDEQLAEIRKGNRAYIAEGTFAKIERVEMLGWVAFAEGNQDEAFKNMRAAADLQDKVGQGEVDIPAREMLADMLLETGHAQQALSEYEVALRLSPNRLNGLYNAGRAAEVAGEKSKARFYYATLMKSTNNGKNSTRPELSDAKRVVSVAQTAAN